MYNHHKLCIPSTQKAKQNNYDSSTFPEYIEMNQHNTDEIEYKRK